jgi:NADH-quinone oxidoreductase subunit M
MLFLLVGVLYSRTHDRRIDSYQGLASQLPLFTLMTAIAFFASLGLPAFSGFIGEIFTLMGVFNSPLIPRWLAGLATFGLVLGAGYFLWTLQRMFFGKFWVRQYEETLQDLTLREKIMLYPLAILTLIFGIFPHLIFDVTNLSLAELMRLF